MQITDPPSSASPTTTTTTLLPFPTTIPTAPLLRISLSLLLQNDASESQRFFTACKELGFFYLDLRNTTEGASILADADKLFDVGEQFFNSDLEEKERYDFSRQGSYFGYKGYGTAVIDKEGMTDRNEFYNVRLQKLHPLPPPLPTLPAPTLLTTPSTLSLLTSFITTSHALTSLLLTHLTTHLSLPSGTLTSLHRLHHLSGDQVRFVKAPPQPRDDTRVALGEHTDFGSVTVLFNRLGGLQVLLPAGDGEGQWLYVKPLPGHAVVNLGDAMVKFTGGLLRSNVHRVVAPPGEQAGETRYSLVYFSRPEDEVLLERLESGVIPRLGDGEVEEEVCAREWIIRRALGKRVGMFREEEWEEYQGTDRVSARSRM